MSLNTFPCSRLDEKGVTATIKKGRCILTDRKENVSFENIPRRRADVFLWQKTMPASRHIAADIAATKGIEKWKSNSTDWVKSADRLWHQRLARSNGRIINATLNSSKYDMTSTDKPSTNNYLKCVLPKQTETRSTGNLIIHSKPTTVHAQGCNPMKETSYCGSHYILTMNVAEQQYVRVKLLNNRESVGHYFHDYICWVQCHMKMKLSRKHTYNGADILSMRRGIERLRIILTTSSALTP